ncbi:hypothetical protein HYH03_007845 [Edaphochlamys debaryana]|uniref:Prenyltransferase alpha-alpha toroid domain-containing protein n=1 Tax=Edaphochlamys debaryana TaxID=47281 RepID=A0A835YAD8_9CHLO|nr:hypothetical protein HYH03_007845 [Edaphochlamys debaryana]|eukprot:KAG2493909.1 hypothetical protein HYH03_007845 [Edaphochlamys debaryana]
MWEDGLPTATSKTQNALEKKILPFYQELEQQDLEDLHDLLELHRDTHISYLQTGLGQLSSGFAVLDASRTWIVYWLVHSLALLGAPLPREVTADDIVAFLGQCQHPDGGFGGGPLQLAHLAPTYAAVAAAVTLGGKALAMVDRVRARDFLFRMCIPPSQGGGFSVHDGGEGDLRACYTAMAVAHMLGMDADKPELLRRSGLAGYVRACQTYEGGLGGEPGNEAHGGYTFCGVAALALAGGPELLASALDLSRLLHWLVHRQGAMEGGFNGRTNKLVDGCYSFWQGGVFPLLAQLHPALLRPPPVPPSAAPAADPAVPPAPMFGDHAIAPAELAELEVHACMTQYESLRSRALAASEQADAALRGTAARHSANTAAGARELLDRAAVAHEAAELATTQMACVNASAFNLCPPLDPEALAAQEQALGPPPPLGAAAGAGAGSAGGEAQAQAVQGHGEAQGPGQGHGEAQGPGQAAAGGAGAAAGAGTGPGAAAGAVAPALCSYESLQLWILKCCQASKGGLRDKPGKPADFYHTCYCLSGLAAAQHAPGSSLMGPRDTNLLRRADPAVNVVDEKLAAARSYFAARPLPPLPQAGDTAGVGAEAPVAMEQGA